MPKSDLYQQKIQDYVFPRGWKNPKPSGPYDFLVVGGGPGGMTALTMARQLGAKAAIIEKEHFGGECFNVGCIPSKALLRSSRLAAEMHNASAFGIEIPKGAKVNFLAVMQRVWGLQATLAPHDSAEHFKKLEADVFLGRGHFTGSNTLEVGGQTLRFKKALITAGTYPIIPDVKGLKETGFLTNQNVFRLTALPARLVVIGAGPIGCELSQAFARFGSHVTLITRGVSILPRDDRMASQRLHKVMEKEGMQVLLNTQVQRVEKRGKEKVLYVNNRSIIADEILIAVGRSPIVEDLGLERAEVTFDHKKGIETNDFFQTSNPDIYTSGDSTSPYKFTHISKETAMIVVQNALEGKKRKKSSIIVPWCTYTDPEIAHIGLQENEAEAKGIALQTTTVEMRDTDRALLDGETEGFVKISVREGSDQIVGATIMARHAGDMISEIAVAMASEKGVKAIAEAIHPFPTQAEAVRSAAAALVKAQSKKGETRLRRTA